MARHRSQTFAHEVSLILGFARPGVVLAGCTAKLFIPPRMRPGLSVWRYQASTQWPKLVVAWCFLADASWPSLGFSVWWLFWARCTGLAFFAGCGLRRPIQPRQPHRRTCLGVLASLLVQVAPRLSGHLLPFEFRLPRPRGALLVT
jgi:hypothetical protein